MAASLKLHSREQRLIAVSLDGFKQFIQLWEAAKTGSSDITAIYDFL